MRTLAALMIAILVTLTGCSSTGGSQSPDPAPSGPVDQSVLQRLGFEGMSGQQIVDKLDRDSFARPGSYKASVRPDALVLGDDQGETSVPLDTFYLSTAPYLTRTHPCHFHSLTTCMGELPGHKVHVKIVDDAGKVLVDEDTTTFTTNGFIGYWLPKGITGTITISDTQGHSGTAEFTTSGAELATCLTTLQMQ